jgi:glycerate kinase
VIEAAEMIALADVDRDHRHPATLSSEGLGALILEAISTRPRRMIVGLGDTATHDCGLGIGAALGYRFLDAEGNLLEPVGASLMALASIDRGGARELVTPIIVYCDVLNPLLGEDGAARRFASQKGALPEEVESLEHGGERFAMIVERDLGVRVADVPGAGAAGGLGAGLVAFAGASLTGGADAVLDAVRFDERATACDLVISGEGRLDAKTMLGKGVGNVARRVRRIGARMLVIAGSLEGERSEWERKLGAHVALLDDAGPTAAASLARAVLAGMRDEG